MGKPKNLRLMGSYKINGGSKRRSDLKFYHRDYLKSVHRKIVSKNRYSIYKRQHNVEKYPKQTRETGRRSKLQIFRKNISKDRPDFRESRSKQQKWRRRNSISSSPMGSPLKRSYFSNRAKEGAYQPKNEVKDKSKTKVFIKTTNTQITESYMNKIMARWLPVPSCIPVVYPCCHSFVPNWCGTLNIWESVKCQIIMEPLPGHCYQFSHLKKNNLEIVGGIKRSAVWQCMHNIKTRGKKKVAIVLIKPLSVQESESYNRIFNYFYTRRHIGHVGYRTNNMSFFLLLPLPARKSLKSVLKSFQSESFSELKWQRGNTNIILGIMILQPHEDVQLHNVPNLLQVSTAQTLHTSPLVYCGPVRTPALPLLQSRNSPPGKPTKLECSHVMLD